jgi:SH3 domain protein
MDQSSWATEAYVTDSLKVTLRTGPSNENKIIAVLPSGQPLEVINSKGNWSYVRLAGEAEEKKEGWMLSQYLMTRVPWESQVAALKKENASLKEKLPDIENRLSQTARREQDLTKKLQNTAQSLQELQREYETLKREAAQYLKLKATHQATRSSLKGLQEQVQVLDKENQSLRSSERNKWFAIGALVLLCGLVFGMIIGRQQKKRRYY